MKRELGCSATAEVETKLTMAAQFGAADVMVDSGSGVVEKVGELTVGGGDHSFEAPGANRTAERAAGRRQGGDHWDDPGVGPNRHQRRPFCEGAEDSGEKHQPPNWFRPDIPGEPSTTGWGGPTRTNSHPNA